MGNTRSVKPGTSRRSFVKNTLAGLSAAALFSLSLHASRQITLKHVEVHLLFTAADGSRSSHRLYAANHRVELQAGADYLLDDNYIE